MESRKRDYEQILEHKTLKRSSYNNRKECIKKKTMELATLCGINACTVIYGPHGEIESWPENKAEAKAIIKKFKDSTSNSYKRITVRDESRKNVGNVPGGEVVSCQENLTEVKDGVKNFDGRKKKVLAEADGEVYSWLQNPGGIRERSSLTGYQEFLKQLDLKLEALQKRIEFLRTDQESETNCCCVENNQLDYSEENNQTSPSPKSRRISQEPLFVLDLNYPPPDESECSSLSCEVCTDLRL